jgi:hypothetical protein
MSSHSLERIVYKYTRVDFKGVGGDHQCRIGVVTAQKSRHLLDRSSKR